MINPKSKINQNHLTQKSVTVSVSRETLEEMREILKEIREQDKGRLAEVSRSIPCRIKREKVEAVWKKVSNLLE